MGRLFRKQEGKFAATLVIDLPHATLEAPTIEKEEATSQEIEMPWNVIVHNDPVNLMSYVTMVFQCACGARGKGFVCRVESLRRSGTAASFSIGHGNGAAGFGTVAMHRQAIRQLYPADSVGPHRRMVKRIEPGAAGNRRHLSV